MYLWKGSLDSSGSPDFSGSIGCSGSAVFHGWDPSVKVVVNVLLDDNLSACGSPTLR